MNEHISGMIALHRKTWSSLDGVMDDSFSPFSLPLVYSLSALN